MSFQELVQFFKKHWATSLAVCVIIIPIIWFVMEYLYKTRLEEKEAKIRLLEEKSAARRVNRSPSITDLPEQKSVASSAPSPGSIERPKSGSVVDPEFSASGTIQLLSSEFGWLTVRKGSLYWPKEPGMTKSGSWTLTVFEGGPPGKFFLALITVNDATNERIINWFEQGRRTHSYPGMTLKQGIRVVDEIELSLAQRR